MAIDASCPETVKAALDNPAWHALASAQADLGRVGPLAGIYDPAIGPFAGLRDRTCEAFDALHRLADPDQTFALVTPDVLTIPPDWSILRAETLEQFVFAGCGIGDDPITPPVELGPDDVPEMQVLVDTTAPGPFAEATIRFGRYIGYRDCDHGGLIAMAGERMRTDTATEISTVCTAPGHRGCGLAGMLVRVLVGAAITQGRLPFLHVRTGNRRAMALYEGLGFRHRRRMHLSFVRAPSAG